MRFDIITIFPKIFDSYLKESILKRAQKNKTIEIRIYNLRDFSPDKHKRVALRQAQDNREPRRTIALRQAQSNREPRRTIDDKPYGGGPGMVLKIEPIFKAVQSLKSKRGRKSKIRIILFSLRGKKFNQKIARRLNKYNELILICGRYEGIDERTAKHIADEEISIGDYVLSGGELPALVLIETVSRQIKGVLGKKESLEEIKGSYPTYTRPEKFIPVIKKKKMTAWRVPRVLLSGNHKKIEKWRQVYSQKI